MVQYNCFLPNHYRRLLEGEGGLLLVVALIIGFETVMPFGDACSGV